MDLTGQHLLAGNPSRLGADTFEALDPRHGGALGPSYAEATPAEVDTAMAAASAARSALRDRERRALFLEAIAEEILALGPSLLERAHLETALPLARLEGERGRAVGQLRLLAATVREGSCFGLRIDHGDATRQPLPKPDIRRMLVPLGPVVVFGASNFPLAFSVAGGDSAAAWAAGCPVVHKAHPGHPGTAELVGRAVTAAAARCQLAPGVFSLLHGAGHDVGLALVRHSATEAVAFTGSLRGGRALFDAAAQRPRPIPVYAEMGSVNPVFCLPNAVSTRGSALAAGLTTSITMGVGQFCTNPGLIFAVDNAAGRQFAAELGRLLADTPAGTMLYPALCRHYLAQIERRATHLGEPPSASADQAMARLFVVDAARFRAEPSLANELFGPSSLLVFCRDLAEMAELAASLDGQLTATLHAEPEEIAAAHPLLDLLETKAGRLLWGGFPTGVEVCAAMQHGGPYPATTDSRSTSVGTAALDRFLRPVAYQNLPTTLLPSELRDDTPNLWRLVDLSWHFGPVERPRD